MRLLLLSDANSVHTQKWAFSLQKEGVNLHVFSLMKPTNQSKLKYESHGIEISSPDLGNRIKNIRTPNASKLSYVLAMPKLRKLIRSFAPHLVHAHYASSYGVLGYLSGFHPFVISVWGSDIMDFPNKNRLYKYGLSKVLASADQVCSTSEIMAKDISQNMNIKHVEVIPFGVDTKLFAPNSEHQKNDFIVGTIKSIESYNGIDCLLDAAKIVAHDGLSMIKFLIVGEGTLKNEMDKKSQSLNLQKNVKFVGHVQHDEIVEWFQKLSIFIAVSTRESFGVSILEAAACGIPAITSNVGGLPEVNSHNETGIVIPPERPEILADYILKLYKNEQLRNTLGKNARTRVISNFNWDKSVSQMLKIYNKLCP